MNVISRICLTLLLSTLPLIGLAADRDAWRHTSPVPNLIKTYINTHSDVPKALLEQQAVLDSLHRSIVQEEDELMEAALDDEQIEDLDQRGQMLMQSRQELIKQGIKAIDMLNSELDAADSTKLLQANQDNGNTELLSNSTLQLKHSNPLPELVNFILLNDIKPALLDPQRERLQQWQTERTPVFAEQAQSIVEMESQLTEMVLQGDSIDAINKLADEIAQLRVRIIRGKVFSREKLKQILQNEQYQVLLGLYPTD